MFLNDAISYVFVKLSIFKVWTRLGTAIWLVFGESCQKRRKGGIGWKYCGTIKTSWTDWDILAVGQHEKGWLNQREHSIGNQTNVCRDWLNQNIQYLERQINRMIIILKPKPT